MNRIDLRKGKVSLPEIRPEMLLQVFMTLFVLVAGGLLLWRFLGQDLTTGLADSKRLEREIGRMQEEIASSNLRFLEGEEADLVRALFESEASGSEYFNLVLSELGKMSEGGGEIRRVSLSPPRVSSIGERSTFTLEANLPFSELVSFFDWLEGAYPAFHLNRLAVERSGERGLLTARVGGAMYVLGLTQEERR